jgi:hypothetical protein
MVLSIEERVFLVEYVFRGGNRYSDLVPTDVYLWKAAKSAAYRDRPCALNESKTAVAAYNKKHLTNRYAESVCE